MQADANDGKENIGAQDTVVPRVALMQGISPEVQDGRAANGSFFHSVAEIDLGPELDIVVIHYSKRWTLWKPRHEGGGVLARASDGLHWDQPGEFTIAPYKDRPKYKVTLKTGTTVARDIGLGVWGSLDPENPDSGPAATLSHVLVCIAPEYMDLGPFVIFLQRSAEPVGKLLLSKIKVDRAPIYGQIYKMGTKQQESPSGGFNNFVFTKNGHLQDEELFKFLKEQHQFYTDSGVKTSDADEQKDAEAYGSGEAGSGRTTAKDDKSDRY